MQLLAEPLISLVKKIQDHQSSKRTGATPLRDAPFASPDAIRRTLEALLQNLHEKVPDILDNIHLYLKNASTEAILFKPVQVSVYQ